MLQPMVHVRTWEINYTYFLAEVRKVFVFLYLEVHFKMLQDEVCISLFQFNFS